MPRAAKSQADAAVPIRAGDDVEIRVAEVWFWEGYFTRRSVGLQRHYQPVPLQVTDVDLIAVEIDPQLRPRRLIGESKSGTGRSAPRPLDGIIWLRGLMDLLGDAAAAELTIASGVTPQVRDLGRSLSVAVQSIADLERREQRVRVERVRDTGSQGTTGFTATHRAHRAIGREPDLERVFWLVRSDIWYASPWMGLKRLIAAIGFAAQRFAPRADDETQFAVRWLLAELVSQFTLQLVITSAPALTLEPDEYAAYVADQLADPGVDRRRMRQISEAMDRYVAGVLRQARASESAIAGSLGAFMPSPPEYAEALAETARRLSLRVDVARVLPRYVDLMIHERLVRQREPSRALIDRLGVPDHEAMARAARLVGAFLSGQAGLPPTIVGMLGDPATDDLSGVEPGSAPQPATNGHSQTATLFDLPGTTVEERPGTVGDDGSANSAAQTTVDPERPGH